MRIFYKTLTGLFLTLFVFVLKGKAIEPLAEVLSTKQDAIEYLETIDTNKENKEWPNVKSKLFYDNLKLNLDNPLSFYPGRSTNFCAYGALSYIVMGIDPLGYVKFMNELYEKGEAIYNGNHFTPSKNIKLAAGNLKFKGVLDIRHAEQMWFLVLADKFKGYLNFFNKKYDDGDENTFWAATNLAKFNKMIRKMCKIPLTSSGSDLIRPWIKDPFTYLQKQLDGNTVSLFINNRVIHKKNHDKIKFSIPTHFIILKQLWNDNGTTIMRYWDYGVETQLRIRPRTLKKMIFGITVVKI